MTTSSVEIPRNNTPFQCFLSHVENQEIVKNKNKLMKSFVK